ncbi:MAG TPA: DivIVA domain-containing protein [Longimicrobiales bacterium]|nr:DivIVA domain-containing protein [Longimicrobiales bacterium]
MIDLTPLEVRKKKGDFRRAMRGYEPAQVDDFLDIVADRLEQVVRDHGALQDRVAGLERQVAENRERERALTDALVTAQTMRDEIRTKATQEGDVLKQRAEQDAGARVKDAQQQAEALLQQARQDAEAQLQKAQRDAEAQLQRARGEAEAQVGQARQAMEAQLLQATQTAEAQRQRTEADVARLRSAASEMRQREIELLRELRERQQKLLGSYRGFLERELHELTTMAESIAQNDDDLPPLPPLPAPAPLAAGVLPRAQGDHEFGAARGSTPESAAAGSPPAAGEAAAVTEPGGSREPAALAGEAAPQTPDPSAELAEAPVEPGTEPAAGTVDLDAIIADATQGLATVGRDPLTGEDLPPFAPEPVYDEDLGTEPAGEEPDEAALLLENAELAGYHIELLDDDAGPSDSELLLEESEPEDRDDDWLSSMIRDDR